jgi:hypothetical protein
MKLLKSILKNVVNFKGVTIGTLEKILGSYITYHLRPKASADIDISADTLNTNSKVAIIIQGPLLKKDNFTLNTIQIYKKFFSNYQIILSTWKDEDNDYLNEMRNEQIEIILNDKPSFPGIQNINYQILSTRNAVNKAREIGVDYVLKTRTDIRLYNPNSIEFLVNLLKTFPPVKESGQNKRIAFPSLNTFKYRPYSVTDIVMFGETNDMMDYWSVSFDTRTTSPADVLIGDFSRARLGEIYLSTNYLEKIGRELKWTISDSWDAFASCFCIFDAQSIGLYWNKHDRNREYRRSRYNVTRNDQELNFAEWLNIFAGLNNKHAIPEYILNDQFAAEIKGQI